MKLDMVASESNTTIVIFGASGDLSQRKLIPALFSLYRKERLSADLCIVGFASQPWNDDEFRSAARAGVDQFAYFDGDSGAGLGASHQTGWTGLVADRIQHGEWET